MGRKKREIIWHKKRGKFMPSSVIRPHSSSEGKGEGEGDPQNAPVSRRKKFARGLLEKIKKAVQQSSDSSS